MGSTVIRILIGVLLSGGVLLFTYLQGRSDCATKWERKQAEIRQEWAEKVADAAGAASDRALENQRLELENERLSDEIVAAARQEQGADDICLSADIVERLRQLQ